MLRDALLEPIFTVPQYLTDDRSRGRSRQCGQRRAFGTNITPSSDRPDRGPNFCNAKLPNGQYLIPSANISADPAISLGVNAIVQGPAVSRTSIRVSRIVDYNLSDKDRLSVKYYVQDDPTTNPFGASRTRSDSLSSSQPAARSASIENTVILSPSSHLGTTRWLHSPARVCEHHQPGLSYAQAISVSTYLARRASRPST